MRRALTWQCGGFLGLAVALMAVTCSRDHGETKQEAKADEAGASGALPERVAWLLEAKRWRKVAGASFTEPACSVYEALAGEMEFPTLRWDACGAGCERTDVLHGWVEFGTRPNASTEMLEGTATPLLAFGFSVETDETWHVVRRVLRLDTGRSLGALKTVWSRRLKTVPCTFDTNLETATTVNVVGGNQGDPKQKSSRLDGIAPLARADWTWATPALPRHELKPALMGFDIDVPERVEILVGAGAVYKQISSSSSRHESLEAASTSYAGAGQGDLAVWLDNGSRAGPSVKAWAADDQGVRTLVATPPRASCWLGISPTHIVGLAASGSDLFSLCEGPIDDARLWRTPRAYAAAQVTLTEGPKLASGPIVVSRLKTWGDYAALMVQPIAYAGGSYTDKGDPQLIVTRLSTWKSWRISAESDRVLHADAWTLTPDYLYFGQTNPGANGAPRLVNVVRVPLDRLGAYGDAL